MGERQRRSVPDRARGVLVLRPSGQSYEIRMLDNRKIGELPEINGKLVKVRGEQAGPCGGLCGSGASPPLPLSPAWLLLLVSSLGSSQRLLLFA